MVVRATLLALELAEVLGAGEGFFSLLICFLRMPVVVFSCSLLKVVYCDGIVGGLLPLRVRYLKFDHTFLYSAGHSEQRLRVHPFVSDFGSV